MRREKEDERMEGTKEWKSNNYFCFPQKTYDI